MRYINLHFTYLLTYQSVSNAVSGAVIPSHRDCLTWWRNQCLL